MFRFEKLFIIGVHQHMTEIRTEWESDVGELTVLISPVSGEIHVSSSKQQQ